MRVLFDNNGYIRAFVIGENDDLGDEEINAVELPNPVDIEHFVEYSEHYTKDGFDEAHYEAWLIKQKKEEARLKLLTQIEELKIQLSFSDYKVIKCMEAQLLGEEMPYDIEAVHAERQAIRDKINELEQ